MAHVLTYPPRMSLKKSKRLRIEMTDAERRIWAYLRNRQVDGLKFRRQVPIDRFVVDFLCVDLKLIVEIDGGQHARQTDSDAYRTNVLEAYGYRVLRYWNHDVLSNTDGVIDSILQTANLIRNRV